MIVVIADDLSGAAELVGTAFAHGLSAEVQTRFRPDAPSRVVCIDMEGRAASARDAATEMRALYQAVAEHRPEWVFLKFDSVLRGNIAAQLHAALEASGCPSAILITANPSRGRTIRGGDYFIDGAPLHRTSFADDPVYPCRTSSVRELLGSDDARITTPDIATIEDLERWASSANPSMLLAGSAEFFGALLRIRTPICPRGDGRTTSALAASADAAPGAEPVLIVCGSRASWGTRVAEAGRRGVAVFDILDDPREAAASLLREGVALLGIGERPTATSPSTLLDELGDAVAAVCSRVSPARLLLEGGGTAAAVVQRMNWTRLVGEADVGGGVATLRPPDGAAGPLIFIKPGSYPWPREIW